MRRMDTHRNYRCSQAFARKKNWSDRLAAAAYVGCVSTMRLMETAHS